ncbi:MAG: serine hydrolase [Saprospiraceae bacterium]|nr:serine hydrolase [Saprospiraceae bacterium]
MRSISLAISLLLTLSLSSCHVGRFFIYNFSDIKDYQKFPESTVDKGEETFNFIDGTQASSSLNLPENWLVKEDRLPFQEALETSKTVAFMVIRNDSILYEQYMNGYNRESIVTSFSVVKSYVSALMGIAISEGYVGSVNDPITNYLPYLDDPAFAKITIEHLLNMESGISFNESYYTPFSDAAKYYYGRNLEKYLTKLKIEREPGQGFRYKSVNTILLAQIIESATKQPLNEYMSSRIWQKIGAEFDGSLSMDKKEGIAKAFAGLNGKAIDFAKFGRLYLNKGQWEGQQIVPAYWVDRSSEVGEGSDYYGYRYQWWRPQNYQKYKDNVTYNQPFRIINDEEGQPNYVAKPNDYYTASGHLGQYIAIVPQHNMLIIRFGKKPGNLNWYQLFQWLAMHN